MTCKYPWSSIYVDNNNGKFNVKPCCRASNSVGTADSIEEIYDHPALQQIRDTFSSGATPAVCSTCVDKREDSISDPVFKDSVGIVDWDIRTDHVCNLKCAMCNPYQSSKWHEDLEASAILCSSVLDWLIGTLELITFAISNVQCAILIKAASGMKTWIYTRSTSKTLQSQDAHPTGIIYWSTPATLHVGFTWQEANRFTANK